MGAIYRNAKAMIVVDRDLMAVEGMRRHRTIHVWFSDWMTRLWTLQEGWMCMAKVHFAFKDRLVPMYELAHGLFYLNTLSEILNGAKHPLVIGSDDFGEGADHVFQGDIMKLAVSLRTRSTSKSWDEAICLATILGYDVLALPVQPKLEDLLALMRASILMELAFISGARSELQGFRWAPKTLLDRRTNPPGSETPRTVTTLSPKGIRLVKDTILFAGSVTIPQGRNLFFLIQPSQTPDIAAASFTITIVEDNDRDNDSSNTTDTRLLTDVALVYSAQPDVVAKSLQKAEVAGLSLVAMLVSGVREDEDHDICAQFEMTTMVMFDTAIISSDLENNVCPKVEGRLATDFAIWVD